MPYTQREVSSLLPLARIGFPQDDGSTSWSPFHSGTAYKSLDRCIEGGDYFGVTHDFHSGVEGITEYVRPGGHKFSIENVNMIGEAAWREPGNYGDFGYPSLEAVTDLNMMASQQLQRMNPSRPDVSIPVFLGELRDLPSQIYDSGKQALRSTSGIGVKFGILPMARDVANLVRLSDLTDRRLKMLKRLFKEPSPGREPGMRVRKRIRSRRTSSAPTILRWDGVPLSRTSCTAYEEVWTSTRWVPNKSYNVPSLAGGLEGEALRLTLGLGATKDLGGYAADTWELLPWSWFADWFGNFSEHIDQHLNQGVATSTVVWLMQRRFAQYTASSLGSGGSQKQTLSMESKQRFMVLPHFEMTMPLLSAGQVSILSDLMFGKRKTLRTSRPNPGGGDNV